MFLFYVFSFCEIYECLWSLVIKSHTQVVVRAFCSLISSHLIYPSLFLLFLRATIRAAIAFDVRRGAAAIRDDGRKDPGRGEEVADFRWHDARNEGVVEGKRGEVGEGTDLRRNGARESVRMHLQEFHGRENSNVVDATRQLIVIDICETKRG